MKLLGEIMKLSALGILYLLIAFPVLSNAQIEEGLNQEIKPLIIDYYRAVQNQDVEALAALHVFSDENDRKQKTAAMRNLFQMLETTIEKLDIKTISMHPDRTLGTAFVNVVAKITNIESTDSFSTEKEMAIIVSRNSGRWRILRVMTRDQYESAVRLDILNRKTSDLVDNYETEQRKDTAVTETFVQNPSHLTKNFNSRTSSSANRQPVAEFTFMPQAPQPGDALVFTSTSFDLDGDKLQYTWYFGDDHIEYLDNRSNWEYTIAELNSVPIRLVVKDGRGGMSDVTHTIHVGKRVSDFTAATGIEDMSQIPFCEFTYMPKNPVEGDPIVLVNMSTSPGGDDTYLWYVDNKHIAERDNQMSWELLGLTKGSHKIELEVRHASGGGMTIIKRIEIP